ncbi:NADPH-dependent oxidoreductase [Pueribacillus theae]|uniref:NADPH-dependent oxidoreductase n=1 Tax=Pueribacillus theae TaxID=2171751 RepID=A0A2U1K387_9BACI|nr:NADPH-dependent oxidoreductase [Pueribacillus theae]PWA11971.1 NADPH-dependent oxidoreductase [Pueribacillus theae]
MNEVVSTLMNHRSYRRYSDKPIENKDLDMIIRASQAAPSWHGGQQVSIISIKDKERKNKIAKLSGDQIQIIQAPIFLIFCADFYRVKIASEMEGKPFESVNNIDILLVGATDVGLALSNAIATAESLGLGIVPIGGIRRNSLKLIDMLNLPKYVIPISGLCIGYPKVETIRKPRFSKQAIYHEEQYNHNLLEYIKEYNKIYEDYMKMRSVDKKSTSWSKRISNFYSQPFYHDNSYPETAKMLKQQGFPCQDI